MSRKLSQMTRGQFESELSIAGNPKKIMDMYGDMLGIMGRVDETSGAELINLEFLLKRMTAEAHTWIRLYEQRTGQKII